MSFAYKTLFSSNSIKRITNISVSYLNEPNLIIDTNCLIMNYEQTEISEFWGYKNNYFYEVTIPNTVEIIHERSFENSTVKGPL